MKHIALYGGSFDPPHLGHVITIAAVLNAKAVDEIWLVPTGRHRDKEHRASTDDRKAMIAIMLATMFGSKVPVRLDTSQLDNPLRVSKTAELLTYMRDRHPNFKFSFVIGSDLLPDIPRWHAAKELMKEKLFLVVPRLGHEYFGKLPKYATAVTVRDLALTNVSSSLVRKMIAQGHSLEGTVPPAVISHILRNRLYRTNLLAVNKRHITLNHGNFLRFVARNGWEFVERCNCTGVVVVIAMTDKGNVLLTEQYRVPVGKSVIEFPAGLVGDSVANKSENMKKGALRELLEETGYRARSMTPLITGPTSAGLTSEIVTFLRARGLEKVSAGLGDGTESIRVHEVPLKAIHAWLAAKIAAGKLVDPKVYAGLYFLKLHDKAIQEGLQ